jgi:putative transposase
VTRANVKGKWRYLYRAIDRDGNLVDSLLSETRDLEAAKRFFKQAVAVVGHAPEWATTDGHGSYPRAIRETLGCDVTHPCNPYLNNRLEQDHRGIKLWYYPLRGFGSVAWASRFCRAFEEVRQFFRVRTTMKQSVSLAKQREMFRRRLERLKAMMLVAEQRERRGGQENRASACPLAAVLTYPAAVRSLARDCLGGNLSPVLY